MDTRFIDSAIKRSGPRALGFLEIPHLIIQGIDTKICGPACVAMALDCHPSNVLAIMKSKGGGTRTKQLVVALQEYYNVDGKLAVWKDDDYIPDRSILKITIKNRKQGHWVLLWNDFIYDPSWGVFPRQAWEDSFRERGCRITSYLELRLRE